MLKRKRAYRQARKMSKLAGEPKPPQEDTGETMRVFQSKTPRPPAQPPASPRANPKSNFLLVATRRGWISSGSVVFFVYS